MSWTSAVSDRVFSLGYHISFIQTPNFRQKKTKDKSISAVTNCTRFHFWKSDQLPKLHVYLHLLIYVVSEIRTRSHILSHGTDNPYLVLRHFRKLLWIRNVKNISFPFTADDKLTTCTKLLWIHIQGGLWALNVHRCYRHSVVNRALLRAHQQYYHDATTNNPFQHHTTPIMCVCVLAASVCPISWPDTPIVFRSDRVHHLITTSPLLLFCNAFLLDQSVTRTHTHTHTLFVTVCVKSCVIRSSTVGAVCLNDITTWHLNTVHGAPRSVCRCVSYGSK
jgi:hypothetical protein